tara:strand:- start:26684 stop:27946 length:1263 start_codon:yes stop_codon:yes gene_type:complete
LTRTGGVSVLGAGVVGICCARFLQKEGFDVTLIDRDEPGTGTSSGNLGMICSLETSLPLPSMRVLCGAPKMLLDPYGALVVRWRHLPHLLPWLARFVRNASPSRRWGHAQVMATLMRNTVMAYDSLIEGSSARGLIRHDGAVVVYETDDGFAADAGERAMLKRLGADFDELEGAAIHDLEPALAPNFVRGVHHRGCAQTHSPLGLSLALLDDFRRDGGTIRRANASAISVDAGQSPVIETDCGAIPTESLVVSCGAWSGRLAASVGLKVPLEAERGYHMAVPGFDSGLRRPIIHGESNIGLTQMIEGLRIGGTVELAGLEAPPTPGRAQRIYDVGRRMLADPEHAATAALSDWMGYRPTLPDYLPAIGPSPHHANLWFAFGHQHVGLSLAARTGQLIATLLAGRSPDIDLEPFRVDRFGP